MRSILNRLMVAAIILTAMSPGARAEGLPDGFVYLRDIDPTIVQDMRYFSDHNFLGRRVAGYEAGECILAEVAARKLAEVQARLAAKTMSLKVYDCYRPQRAVNDFVAWAEKRDDTTTKAEFYPTLDKRNLFKLRYIAKRSGHSGGSTVDLAIVKLPPAKEPVFDPAGEQLACHNAKDERFADNSLDFGTGYDCFHELSHTANPAIKGEARANRDLLVSEMRRVGFSNYRREWWHFDLDNPPFPKKFFDFPIVARPTSAPAAAPDVANTAEPFSLDLVCVEFNATAPVLREPTIEAEVVAELPPGILGMPGHECTSDLGEWREASVQSDAPWCRISFRLPTTDAIQSGWINGQYLIASGAPIPSCSP
jgi:D-alanyl-D-alanine dipeptidase